MTQLFDATMAEALPDYSPPTDARHPKEVFALVQWLRGELRWREGTEGRRLLREHVLTFARSRTGFVAHERRASTCQQFLDHLRVKTREARPVVVDRRVNASVAAEAAALVALLDGK